MYSIRPVLYHYSQARFMYVYSHNYGMGTITHKNIARQLTIVWGHPSTDVNSMMLTIPLLR